MPVSPIRAKGSTLPADVVTAIVTDWQDAAVQKGEAASEVTLTMEGFDTERSNRAFDVLLVARDAAATLTPPQKGMKVGTKTWVEVVTPAVDAIPAHKGEDGKTIPAVPAVPAVEVLHVQTYWKRPAK